MKLIFTSSLLLMAVAIIASCSNENSERVLKMHNEMAALQKEHQSLDSATLAIADTHKKLLPANAGETFSDSSVMKILSNQTEIEKRLADITARHSSLSSEYAALEEKHSKKEVSQDEMEKQHTMMLEQEKVMIEEHKELLKWMELTLSNDQALLATIQLPAVVQ
ncbi:MAG TPA: hypothetical protein PLD84_10055 [Chitinophagales bacterium]|nr:hypothetical protein [Chitinophagales bacterium]